MRDQRKAVIAASQALHARGWVANHDGNITVRLAADRFLATPTATSKADVSSKNLIEVDGSGKRTSGTARPFSELAIHLAIYRQRSDVGAVVHAHPPYATAIGSSGSACLATPFVGEAVVSIGATIPTLPFEPPAALSASVAQVATSVDAVLCAGNGVFAWGADLEQASLRLELVEHLARIATLAIPHGGVKPLPSNIVSELLAKRAKSGLGAAAERAADGSQPIIACAPAPHSNVEVATPPSRSRAALASAIREEVIAALRETEQ